MRKMMVLAMAAMLSAAAVAADRVITVTGKSELQLRPDLSRVTVEVRSLHVNYAEAYQVAEENLKELGKVMDGCGLERTLPKTSYFNIARKMQAQFDEYHNYIGEKPVGYELQQNIHIDLAMDNQLVTKVIRGIGAQMKDVEIAVVFTTKDTRVQQLELLEAAVKDARAKAECMAAAAGCKLGKVQTIDYTDQPVRLYAQARKMSAANDMLMCTEESLDITPEDVKVSAQVAVVWEIR